MQQTFKDLWLIFFNFIQALLDGLNDVLIAGGLTDLKTQIISLRIFSDNPIIELDIYTILTYLLLLFSFILFYKFIKIIIRLPFRVWKI